VVVVVGATVVVVVVVFPEAIRLELSISCYSLFFNSDICFFSPSSL
jgi:hypothetical protein